MAKNKEEKTNVMRVLEQKKIAYTAHTYPHEEGMAVDGVTVAKSMGFDPAIVFKTLVARGASKQYYVFDVPVAENLDLKKAAKAVGEKSIEMIHQKELLPLTGYVHGGCSPVGMKKLFPTVFHSSAENLAAMIVSAGKIGYQVELAPHDLAALVRANLRISLLNEVDIKNSEEYAGLAAANPATGVIDSWQVRFLSKAQEKITSRTSTSKFPATR